MKKSSLIISFLSLALIVLAPTLFYMDSITLETNKMLMTIATAAWFASSFCWMGREKKD